MPTWSVRIPLLYWFIILLLASDWSIAQSSKLTIDYTPALEHFAFDTINYNNLDSTMADYFRAMEHGLYHRYAEAETLLKRVIRQPGQTQLPAQHYLLNELYFWRGYYADYVQLSDQLNIRQPMYAVAKQLAKYPAMRTIYSADSIQLPMQVKKHSYVIVNVRIHGQVARLILDSGASSTIMSQKFSRRLTLPELGSLDIQDALGASTPSTLYLLDTLTVGPIRLTHVPIVQAASDRLFRSLGVDGLIGWDVLREFCYTIDFPKQTLTIRRHTPDSTRTKNLFGIGFPIMTVFSLTGTKLNLYYDSGTNSVDLTARGVARLVSYRTKIRPGLVTGLTKRRLGLLRYVKDMTFTVDGQSFQQKTVYLTPVERYILNIRADGVMGNYPFRNGRLTIDYLNNHFRYQP